MKRIALALIVALGLAPGTFVRSDVPPKDYTSPVTVSRLAVEKASSGPLVLEGAWELASENDHFGGFSALVIRPSGEFLSASDAGRLMTFPRPDRETGRIALEPFLSSRLKDKMAVDVESLAINPITGELWAGLEWSQEILALGTRFDRRDSVKPAEMQGWGDNSGPEAMVRLADGRFLVIEERKRGDGSHDALLFPRDPVLGDRPVSFIFEGREGYRPSGAALLPDGRIAVLMRGIDWGLPLRFSAQLVTADPIDIAGGGVLPHRFLASVDFPDLQENYEGLAVIEDTPGQWDLWLISDDNFASYQRTLLLKLRWDRTPPQTRQEATRQKARREPLRAFSYPVRD